MNEPQDEFAALMARVCRGDEEEALAALIALYEPAIRRAAEVLLGRDLRSSIDPTDLVQSVHLEMILGLRRGKLAIASPGHLRRWQSPCCGTITSSTGGDVAARRDTIRRSP